MRCNTFPSRYKDLDAVSIQSEHLQAQFLPTSGAKMSSLIYKPLNYELMVQKPGTVYLQQPFDGNYGAGECSGFDDMFPTIDACFYERYPWKGIYLADHGEVWSQVWEEDQEEGCLHFWVNGIRLPYRLEKWVRIDPTGGLRLDYRLTNPTPFEMDFLWAAHMMINLSEGCELVLPEGIKQVANRLSFNGSLGEFGQEHDWPVTTNADGSQRDFRWLRPASAHDADKYFIKGKMPAGWCLLKFHREKFCLKVSFPVETVPYLGILTNEKGFQNLYNIFIEPCTGSFDRIDLARLRGEKSVVQPRSTYEWYLTISFSELGDNLSSSR